MLIDWFTVAAQVINFFILVWLMKKVLYKPIMAAIGAREALVAAELADAADKKSAAADAVEEFRKKNAAFDGERAALLAKAVEEAGKQGDHLLELARAAADALQVKRRDALQRDIDGSSQAFGVRARDAFFTLARRTMTDLANGSLEEQITTTFCGRLRAIEGEDKTRLVAAIDASPDPVSIRSAFELSASQRKTLQTVVDETLQRHVLLRYDLAPQLIGGIELTARGQRVSWSIADYLAAFEQEISAPRPSAGEARTVAPAAEQVAPPGDPVGLKAAV